MERSEDTDIVDQLADTVESTDEASTVPQDAPTVAKPHLLTLYYNPAPDTPTQISDKFPRERKRKAAGQTLVMGRGENLDVLLNDKHMPRSFVEVWCTADETGTPKWYVKNLSSTKAVRMTLNGNRTTIKSGKVAEIQNGCSLKLEMVTFVVVTEDGDMVDNNEFEIEFIPTGIPCANGPASLNRQNSSSTNSSNSLTSATGLTGQRAEQRAKQSPRQNQGGPQLPEGLHAQLLPAPPYLPSVRLAAGGHVPVSATHLPMPGPQAAINNPHPYPPQQYYYPNNQNVHNAQIGLQSSHGSEFYQPAPFTNTSSDIPRHYSPTYPGPACGAGGQLGPPRTVNNCGPMQFSHQVTASNQPSAMPIVPNSMSGTQQLAYDTGYMNGQPYALATNHQYPHGAYSYLPQSNHVPSYFPSSHTPVDQGQWQHVPESRMHLGDAQRPGPLHGPYSMPLPDHQYPEADGQEVSRPALVVAQPESAAMQSPPGVLSVGPHRCYSAVGDLPAAPPVTELASLKLHSPVQVTAPLPVEAVTASPANSLSCNRSGNNTIAGHDSTCILQTALPESGHMPHRDPCIRTEVAGGGIAVSGVGGHARVSGGQYPGPTEVSGSVQSYANLSSAPSITGSAPTHLQHPTSAGGFPEVSIVAAFSSLTGTAVNGNRVNVRNPDRIYITPVPSARYDSLSSHGVQGLQGAGHLPLGSTVQEAGQSQLGSADSRRQPQEDDERQPQEHEEDQP